MAKHGKGVLDNDGYADFSSSVFVVFFYSIYIEFTPTLLSDYSIKTFLIVHLNNTLYPCS